MGAHPAYALELNGIELKRAVNCFMKSRHLLEALSCCVNGFDWLIISKQWVAALYLLGNQLLCTVELNRTEWKRAVNCFIKCRHLLEALSCCVNGFDWLHMA